MDGLDSSAFSSSSRQGVKVGAPRTLAYSAAECAAITKAMIAAKNDPLNGSSKSREVFHQHFYSKWQALQRGDWPARTLESLVAKYALCNSLLVAAHALLAAAATVVDAVVAVAAVAAALVVAAAVVCCCCRRC